MRHRTVQATEVRPHRPVRSLTLRRWLSVALLVAVASSTVTGCTLDKTGTPASQISGWLTTSGGGAAIGQVQVDSRNVALALSHHNSSAAIKEVCALLTTDAQTAIGNLPTPDNQLTNDLNTAYEDAASAGNNCYNGSNGSKSLLRKSAAERAQLAPLLSTAVDRIVYITGHTPSTSTTLSTGGNNDPFGA
jgi:hypothetical protein